MALWSVSHCTTGKRPMRAAEMIAVEPFVSSWRRGKKKGKLLMMTERKREMRVSKKERK